MRQFLSNSVTQVLPTNQKDSYKTQLATFVVYYQVVMVAVVVTQQVGLKRQNQKNMIKQFPP